MGRRFVRQAKTVFAAVCIAGLTHAVFPAASAAGEMKFELTNRSASPVWVEFYSRDRLKQWPDDGRLFILADRSPRKFTVPCEPGEQICYGAWKEGDITHSWGAGYEGKKDCDDCCSICEPDSEMPLHRIIFE